MSIFDIPDQERKKNVKIQERCDISLGLKDGFKSWKPLETNEYSRVSETLKMVYRYGFRAFAAPESIMHKNNQVISMSNIYKDVYTGLLGINRTAKKYKIGLSLHSNIELFHPDAASREKTREAIRVFCHAAHILDARMFVVRPGSLGSMYEREAIRNIIQELTSIAESLKVEVPIGIQTSGRLREIGSLDHVIEIVKKTQQTELVLNFGNIHARSSGGLRTQADFAAVFDEVERKLGADHLKNPVIYFSTPSYGPSGLIDYVPMAKSDLKFDYLVKELTERGIHGTVIIDTPEKEMDILKCVKILDEHAR